MRKLIILIYKDLLLLLKDKAGLALLFIMPLALVFIMTVLQDNTFQTLKENHIPMAMLDNDKDSLGMLITDELKNSNIFDVNILSCEEQELREKVARGTYQLGVIIPDSASYKLRRMIKYSVAASFSGRDNKRDLSLDSSNIIILIDPTTKTSFRASILSSLKEHTSRVEYAIILNEINTELNHRMIFKKVKISHQSPIGYKEEYALTSSSNIMPNSVQHNIPAWTLFAIFFIVISLSGNMIKERDEGSFTRLLVMPCNISLYISAKIIAYLAICIIQFILMLLMGVYILPLAGIESFNPGTNFIAIGLIALSSALAAICYGLAIGSLAASHQQAANFGSVSVVIMSAIGGIWVPVFAMPYFMRSISVISPLNWGLEGFYDIFVRNLGLINILPEIMKLLIFAAICMLISIFAFKIKRKYI